MALRGLSTNMNRGNVTTKLPMKNEVLPKVVTRRAALGDIGNQVTATSEALEDADMKKVVKKFDEISLKKPTDNLNENPNVGKNMTAVLPKVRVGAVSSKSRLNAGVTIQKVPAKVTSKGSNTSKIPTKINAEETIVKEPASFSVQLLNVEDIDKDDHGHPHLVSDLVNDIYSYMRMLEKKFAIRPNYLQGKKIQPRMRLVLIDWLVLVHSRFGLLQETLFLTVAIIDRVLQELEVTRKTLQLVGVTSMFIAAKYEEMYAPEIADFVYVTDNAYTTSEIRHMERAIMRALDFSFGRPLPLHFLRRNSKAGGADVLLHAVSKYFVEISILEYDMVHYSPSIVAAAASWLAMKLIGNSQWTDTMIHYTTYTEKDLEPVVKKIAALILKVKTSKYKALREKYASSKFFKVSEMVELESPLVKQLAAGVDIQFN